MAGTHPRSNSVLDYSHFRIAAMDPSSKAELPGLGPGFVIAPSPTRRYAFAGHLGWGQPVEIEKSPIARPPQPH